MNGTRPNGWTGGQYSLLRVLFGAYLFIHFAHLLPWAGELFSSAGVLADGSASPILHLFPNILALHDGETFVTVLVAAAAAASLCFAAGFRDRYAAVMIWYIAACLFGRNPLISNPALPYVGWMLLAHAAIPRTPFGAVDSLGRPDPDGAWLMPKKLHTAAWILLALGYSYSGYTKLISPSWVDGTAVARILDNPLARSTFIRDGLLALPAGVLAACTWGTLGIELLFAPLALFRKVRPWLWAALVGMHLGLIVLIDFADLSLGMLFFHFLTFDPAWIPPKIPADESTEEKPTIFYDGNCGLCHRWVRFLLAEDHTARFQYAALGGPAFERLIPEADRAALPDSVVLRLPDGTIRTQTAAVLTMCQQLGGTWRLIGIAGRLVPTKLLDWLYGFIASIRYRLFAKPANACPIIPKDLRKRFVV